jgi:transposase
MIQRAEDMREVVVERIDHLGIVAGIIKELRIIELINDKIPKDEREVISTGEAVAAMIMNGLGFSDRPLTLTPQFFQNKALSRLFGKEMSAEHFNRFKLGRALDDCHSYGCDRLFGEIASFICHQQKIDTRFNHLDTTTFSLTGEYNADSDEHTIEITHGFSKDCRPDLKQAVLELMVSQDGGIPIMSRSWNGNSSDTKIFRERARNLIRSFKEGEGPRYLIADSKLYDQETAQNQLKYIPFITRIPGNIKKENEIIEKAYESSKEWNRSKEDHDFKTFEVEHYGMKQRWIVVRSTESQERAEKSVKKICDNEREEMEKLIKKLSFQRFACECDALKALEKHKRKFKLHNICLDQVITHKEYSKKGRPGAKSHYTLSYQVLAKIEEKSESRKKMIDQRSCYVLGTTINSQELKDEAIIEAYKTQNNTVEKGFRFLKDPLMFTSSLFVKKPERIMGLLMIMTLALLVYSFAQRHVRHILESLKETIPNQANQKTSKPTLRWIFQLMEGIEIVKIRTEFYIQEIITGLNELRKKILGYFNEPIRKIYELVPVTAPDH